MNENIKKKIKNLLPNQFIDILTPLIYRGKILNTAHIYQSLLNGKCGIEIGGPSGFFKHTIPVYSMLSKLDGVNFSNQTLWEGSINSGLNFNYFKNKKGYQYIADATDLGLIKTDSYDFLLSSNCLEHVANPLKALKEWKRIVIKNGYLLLVLPNKTSNFDHKRPITPFEHLLDDFNSDVSEQDLTHLDEILELHDLSKDLPAGNYQKFKQRSLNNFVNRGLHHHVFDINTISKMFEFMNIKLIQSDITVNDYIVIGQIQK